MNTTPGPGQQFGPYRIDQLIGRGGMGEVYRAHHVGQDRIVALKLLLRELGDDEEFRARFRREAQLTARLTEPHIVPIHSWGRIDGRLYLDMRYVEGEDLGDRLERDGPLPPARAVSIVAQVAGALDAAHRAGLVHRDVKPSNILLTDDLSGKKDFAYLVDFGVARSLSSSTILTRMGTAPGTADYMAPERFLEQPIDSRVDVYSLGCVLYECLTGERPFPLDDFAQLMTAHLRASPPPPSRRASVPAALDDVVIRAMAKSRRKRYPTAGDVAAAAGSALACPPVLPRPARGLPTARPRLPAAAPGNGYPWGSEQSIAAGGPNAPQPGGSARSHAPPTAEPAGPPPVGVPWVGRPTVPPMARELRAVHGPPGPGADEVIGWGVGPVPSRAPARRAAMWWAGALLAVAVMIVVVILLS